jgi:negative regulator of sigma E activity
MRDCANVEVRDALPELVHERLAAAERERVLAHVRACADCTAELTLLRDARGVMRRAAPQVDTAAIARGVQARLATSAGPAAPAAPGARSTTWAPPRSASAARPAPRPWWADRGALRVAAAVLLVALGATGTMLARGERGAEPRPGAPAVVATGQPTPAAATPSGAAVPTPQLSGGGLLALGETFTDLSADELAAVIDAVSHDEAGLPVAEPLALETTVAPEGGLP